MKKLILLAFGLLSTIFISRAQTIRVANNNLGAGTTGVNVYTGTNALEDAIAASVSGDIIYLVPSAIGYGNNDITITKALTIFGVGIRPTKDIGTKSIIDVRCSACTLDINASNVRLSGLIIDGRIRLGYDSTSITISNITIENSRINRIEMNGNNSVIVNGLLVRNSVIEGYSSIGKATSLVLYGTANVTITNNIILRTGNNYGALQISGATISYNVFMGIDFQRVDEDLQGNYFDHNIFYGANVDLLATSNNNSWTNNVSFGATNMIFGAGAGSNGTISGNIENNDPLFTNVPITEVWSDSHDFTLLTGSPALVAHILNLTTEDIGLSGGLTPFNPEGNLLPLIQSVTLPVTIPVGTDLPVTIKAKGN